MAEDSEARKRRGDDYKARWTSSESRRARIQSDYERLVLDVTTLRDDKTRLSDDNERLRVRMSQTEGRLKASEDSALNKNRELTILRAERDAASRGRNEALEIIEAQKLELEHLKSAAYKDDIIAEFKRSAEFEQAVDVEAASYLDKGIVHAIRQLHRFVPDKRLLVDMFANNFDAEECRSGTDFVPYTDEELKAVREVDASKGLGDWVPPEPVHPNFWELLDAPVDVPSSTSAIAEDPVPEDPPTDVSIPIDEAQLPPSQ